MLLKQRNYFEELLKSWATHCTAEELYDWMTAKDDDRVFCIFSPDSFPLQCTDQKLYS